MVAQSVHGIVLPFLLNSDNFKLLPLKRPHYATAELDKHLKFRHKQHVQAIQKGYFIIQPESKSGNSVP